MEHVQSTGEQEPEGSVIPTEIPRPSAHDIVIYQLGHVAYVLWVDNQPCGQFFQWYRVIDEALRRAAPREASVWLRENGVDRLLHRPGQETVPQNLA